MHAHPLTCRACGEYSEIAGGCACEYPPVMPEIEHLEPMPTGRNHTFGLRAEFISCDALDAPWLLPMGGVSAVAEPAVADCFVEREWDDDEADARIVRLAEEIEAAELCREAA